MIELSLYFCLKKEPKPQINEARQAILLVKNHHNYVTAGSSKLN